MAHFTLGRCNPDSANGVDKSIYYLARSQAELGHHVAVFSLTDKPPLPIPGVNVFTHAPLRLPIPLLSPRQRDLFVNRSPLNVPKPLVRDIIAWRPDVLHLHFVHIPPNVFLARRLSPHIPYCVTIHGGLAPAAQRRNPWQKRLFGLLFEREYLKRAAFLHAISELDLQGLRAYRVSNRIVLAPNGIDVPPTSPAEHGPSLLLAECLRDRRAFVFLGRLDPEQKGLDLLLKAFAECRPPDAVLVLAGPGWRGSHARLEALARSLGISQSVLFPGPVFGIAKMNWLCAAHAFVHPSRWEAGVPFSVLEAAAVARPCLVTPAADPGGVLERAGAAVLAAPTVESIASGLTGLHAAPRSELRAMGVRARELVRREFSWSRTADILIEAYRTHALAARG